MKMSTPSVTPIQWGVIVTAAANVLRAFGVYDLDQDQQDALVQALGALTALGLFDAAIRIARAKFIAAPIPPDPPIGDPLRLADDEGVTDELLSDGGPAVPGGGALPDDPDRPPPPPPPS